MVTIQLNSKEEFANDESVTTEEKWSVYVDHFVQLSSSAKERSEQREPFLIRNLPVNNTIQGDDIVSTSGLELKICVNTYKIFFVGGTEDYVCRKRSGAGGVERGKGVLDGCWKRGWSEEAQAERRKKFGELVG